MWRGGNARYGTRQADRVNLLTGRSAEWLKSVNHCGVSAERTANISAPRMVFKPPVQAVVNRSNPQKTATLGRKFP